MSITPSDVPHAAHADMAALLHERIVNLKAELGRNALAFGQVLANMRESRGYETLGFRTFEDYLASPAVAVSRRTAYSFMRVAETFAHVRHVAHDADYYKLDVLARLLEPGDDPQAVVEITKQVGKMRRDEVRAAVREEVQRRQATPSQDYQLPAQLTPPPPITATDLLVPAAPVPPVPRMDAPQVISVAITPKADDDDLTVRQYAIMTNYTHLVEDLLKVAHKHRQTLAEVDPGDIAPLTTEADEDREASVLVICDWFARKVAARKQPLRRVK